jgi:asparagine synthase (glutamine-hydrolysing)
LCGIAGLFLLGNETLDFSEAASRMMGALEHRGPDSGGYYVSEQDNMLFVHRRLAIQDLTEAGKQPMFSRSRRYSIVFNGEIYNFRNLAAELESRGLRFAGHSDTEVLLAAIEEWGLERSLERFIGMFAFALWDNQEKNLFLCRDRMGEKPLYYGWVGGNFYFGSELKAIESVVSANRLVIDQEALAGFFRNGYINAPKSIYKGIYKLMPSTFLTLSRENIRKPIQFSPYTGNTGFSPRSYWSLLDIANAGLRNQVSNIEEAVEELDSMLHRTISMQMIADVGVGTFLSGGIDSSLVSAVTQAESGKNIKTFTIGFREADYDESVYAKRIANYLGTEHKTVYVSARDALDVVPNLCSIYDEPFADASQIPSYLVSGIARNEVTVCLSGDGGDELFAGYNRYAWSESIWKKIGPVPAALRNLIGLMLQGPKPEFWDSIYKLFARGSNANGMATQRMVGLKLQKLGGFIRKENLEQGYQYLLSYWDKPEQLLVYDGVVSERATLFDLPDTNEFIAQALYLDQMNYLPGDNLTKVDRASMAVSLETRLPLLSHEIAELSWRIPVSMKVNAGDSKWVLRQVLYKYIPRELIDRPKMGFSVPVAHWLRNELYEWASDLLSGSRARNNSFLNYKEVDRIWREHTRGKNDHALKLWAVLMFLSWTDR